ncbi:hypothetical protein CSHISOI_03171 [Colletotrichum shisoi]|uniref:Uncharacterized protein n=1 Tax=Colletotrichum shisoi TaxID=2078593 RepID=A0A5Q4BYY2_9PEZI|nr:hypothetical protein CSHISOI_03171 [Colletotrichum shisoi]
MVFFKILIAVLSLATAMPSLLTSSLGERACVPPSNCGAPIDVCEFCCASTVVPNSALSLRADDTAVPITSASLFRLLVTHCSTL